MRKGGGRRKTFHLGNSASIRLGTTARRAAIHFTSLRFARDLLPRQFNCALLSAAKRVGGGRRDERSKGRFFEVRFPDNLIAPAGRGIFSLLSSPIASPIRGACPRRISSFFFYLAIDAPRNRPADRPGTAPRRSSVVTTDAELSLTPNAITDRYGRFVSTTRPFGSGDASKWRC